MKKYPNIKEQAQESRIRETRSFLENGNIVGKLNNTKWVEAFDTIAHVEAMFLVTLISMQWNVKTMNWNHEVIEMEDNQILIDGNIEIGFIHFFEILRIEIGKIDRMSELED